MVVGGGVPATTRRDINFSDRRRIFPEMVVKFVLVFINNDDDISSEIFKSTGFQPTSKYYT